MVRVVASMTIKIYRVPPAFHYTDMPHDKFSISNEQNDVHINSRSTSGTQFASAPLMIDGDKKVV